MTSLLLKAIESVSRSQRAFFRYITANDVGSTGSHQAGFYVPKEAYRILFETPGIRGENKDKMVRILWQDDFFTDSRFIYYGVGTRNEYRITRFGRGFPFLEETYSGSLLILSEQSDEEYKAYVLSEDEDIEGFFEHFALSPTNRQRVIDQGDAMQWGYNSDKVLHFFLQHYTDFPETKEMAFWGQKYELLCNQIGRRAIISNPDNTLLAWIETEYKLFRALEEKLYKPYYSSPFESCNQLIEFANTILNRRKSRAGKSLEHHLGRIFRVSKLLFDTQVQTEGNRKPDFIFPSANAYHSLSFPKEKLIFLGAKTTCKDRWRQILNEAERIPHKYLFTLQKGISVGQLREMSSERVTLVVPQSHLNSFAPEFQNQIYSLKQFLDLVQQKQL